MAETLHPRGVESVWESRPTLEGAGVHLRRAFGSDVVPRLDPFLLLDDLRADDPLDYEAGFPWHPHRGIETVTYMLEGRVEHGDSLGNRGIVGPGDVQWLTAGSGIIHQEMPKPLEGRMGGFQLWLNLPRAHKLMDPRYQEVKAGVIPTVEPVRGARVRVVAGRVGNVEGPLRELRVAPLLLDVTMQPHTTFEHPLPSRHRAFSYVLEGRAAFGDDERDGVDANHLVVLKDGAVVRAATRSKPARLLLVAGKPLGEPVAWWGPIVMNTRRELEAAIEEFRAGTFIKHAARVDHVSA